MHLLQKSSTCQGLQLLFHQTGGAEKILDAGKRRADNHSSHPG